MTRQWEQFPIFLACLTEKKSTKRGYRSLYVKIFASFNCNMSQKALVNKVQITPIIALSLKRIIAKGELSLQVHV